jgi:predicted glycosyltransferase involved in capsule biosynthesis
MMRLKRTQFDSSIVRQQNVTSLDISVNESLVVKIFKAVEHFVAYSTNLFLAQSLLVNYTKKPD